MSKRWTRSSTSPSSSKSHTGLYTQVLNSNDWCREAEIEPGDHIYAALAKKQLAMDLANPVGRRGRVPLRAPLSLAALQKYKRAGGLRLLQPIVCFLSTTSVAKIRHGNHPTAKGMITPSDATYSVEGSLYALLLQYLGEGAAYIRPWDRPVVIFISAVSTIFNFQIPKVRI
jgi:hypothetical protein